MKQPDPIWRLFDYACDKFYYIEFSRDDYVSNITDCLRGLLINCGGSRYSFISEYGLHIIEAKKIKLMIPIPIPKDLSDNFREVIETYLKERADFDDTLS